VTASLVSVAGRSFVKHYGHIVLVTGVKTVQEWNKRSAALCELCFSFLSLTTCIAATRMSMDTTGTFHQWVLIS